MFYNSPVSFNIRSYVFRFYVLTTPYTSSLCFILFYKGVFRISFYRTTLFLRYKNPVKNPLSNNKNNKKFPRYFVSLIRNRFSILISCLYNLVSRPSLSRNVREDLSNSSKASNITLELSHRYRTSRTSSNVSLEVEFIEKIPLNYSRILSKYF
jgi:hypothetical protein